MASHVYGPFPKAGPDATRFDSLMAVMRYIFEPWQADPQMLIVFWRVRAGPSGARLSFYDAIESVIRPVLKDDDPAYVEDLAVIITNVFFALLTKVASGQIDIGEVLPTVERAVFRLTDASSR